MKKLSRNEMKNVFGGKIAPPEEGPGGAGCNVACTGTAASNWQGGTCSSSVVHVHGLPDTYTCTCSKAGGSGC